MMAQQAILPQTTQTLGAIQPQEISDQTGVGPIEQNIGHQPEGCVGIHLPSSPSFVQPQAGSKSDELVPSQGPPQGQAGQYGPPSTLVQQAAPALQVGLAVIHARVEEADWNAFGTKARPDILPVPKFLHLSNKKVCRGWPYQANWKGLRFKKLSMEVTESIDSPGSYHKTIDSGPTWA